MLKRIQLIVGLVVFAFQLSYSQIQFSTGVKVGLNFSSLGDVTSSNPLQTAYGSKTGYHAGIYTMIKIKKFAIQPEVILSRQGLRYSVPSSTQNFQSTFDYINVPIMFKYYVMGGLNVHVGPQFSFLSSATGDIINTINNGKIGSITADADLSSYVKSTDVSLCFGAGWEIPFGLNVTARYNLGLTDINQMTGGTIPGTGTVSSLGISQTKSQVFQISLGFKLYTLGK